MRESSDECASTAKCLASPRSAISGRPAASNRTYVRLQIAVDEAARVRAAERLAQRDAQAEGVGERERPAVEPLAERPSLEQRHDDERPGAAHARVEQRHEPLLQPELALQARLAREALDGLARARAQEHLDGHRPAVGRDGAEHAARAAAAQLAQDPVGSQLHARILAAPAILAHA